MFKGDSMYSILSIDATYFFNITKSLFYLNISSGFGQISIDFFSMGTVSKSVSRLRSINF